MVAREILNNVSGELNPTLIQSSNELAPHRQSFSGRLRSFRNPLAILTLAAVGASAGFAQTSQEGVQKQSSEGITSVGPNPYSHPLGTGPRDRKGEPLNFQTPGESGTVGTVCCIQQKDSTKVYVTPLWAFREMRPGLPGSQALFSEPVSLPGEEGFYTTISIELYSSQLLQTMASRIKESVEPLNVTDFYVYFVDSARGNQVLGCGYSQGVKDERVADISVRVAGSNVAAWREAQSRGSLAAFMMYRYENVASATAINRTYGAIDLSQSIETSFSSKQKSSTEPIFRSDRNKFARSAAMHIHSSTVTDDPSLLPAIQGAAQDHLIQVLFSSEITVPMSELKASYPELEANLASYVTPHLLSFKEACRKKGITVVLHRKGDTSESGGGGGFSILGWGASVSHKQIEQEFNELQKNSGFEWEIDKAGTSSGPHAVHVSYLSSGSRIISFDNIASVQVLLPPDTSYIRTNTIRLTHTSESAAAQLGAWITTQDTIDGLKRDNTALTQDKAQLTKLLGDERTAHGVTKQELAAVTSQRDALRKDNAAFGKQVERLKGIIEGLQTYKEKFLTLIGVIKAEPQSYTYQERDKQTEERGRRASVLMNLGVDKKRAYRYADVAKSLDKVGEPPREPSRGDHD